MKQPEWFGYCGRYFDTENELALHLEFCPACEQLGYRK